MDRDTFNNLIQQIGQTEDDVERRGLLATLTNDSAPVFETLETLTKTTEQLKDDNERLRKANMDLFVRLPIKDKPDPDPDNKPKEKRKFENLFNEKGDI